MFLSLRPEWTNQDLGRADRHHEVPGSQSHHIRAKVMVLLGVKVIDILIRIHFCREYMKSKGGKMAFADFLDVMHTHKYDLNQQLC